MAKKTEVQGMEQVAKRLREWELAGQKGSGVPCPVCGAGPAALVIWNKGEKIIGVCSHCHAFGAVETGEPEKQRFQQRQRLVQLYEGLRQAQLEILDRLQKLG